MTKKDFLELLDKYLAGNASNEEEIFLFDVYQRMEDKYEWSLPEMAVLDELEHRMIQRFKNAIMRPEVTGQSRISETRRIISRKYLIRLAAAAVLLLATISAVYWIYDSPSSLITHSNNTRATEKIIFPDNSYVNLAAGSKIIYEKDFSGSLREVYLVGEGFFDVSPNNAKPFIVYTDKVVARVLGTSFIINSGWNNTEARVLVKTGKVSVFKTKEFTKENAKTAPTAGIILLPNHAVDLNAREELVKTLPRSPEILKPLGPERFDFDDTPIDTVFSRLQDTYGIAILYDKNKFSSCSLTVKMGKEDFYQKLELICHTINATYQVRDGNVFVSGPGCAQ